MNLEAIRRRRGELRDANRALVAAARAENRDLTDDERRAFDERLASIEALNGDEQRALAFEADEQRARGAGADTPPTERTAPAGGNPERRFGSFGEQLIAVRRAEGPAPIVDPRLSTRAATGASEMAPSDGGFLVQQDFSAELLRRVYTTGALASRITREIPISGNANGIKINGINETSRASGSRWGGVQTYWVGEADTVTASRPKFRQIELNLHKLMGLFYATDELLADADALGAVAEMAFTDEFAFKVDDALVRGLGSGQPLGILNSSCLVTVSKESGQAAATIMYENLVKMWSRMWGASRQNAVWFINQDVEPQLFTMGLIIGTGGTPVYLPPGGASASPYGTLFGRPVVPIEQCATLGTVGDIILADMSQYVRASKGGMQAASSIHVRFLYDESVFRFTLRTDAQPIWNSALTPANGSNTLSPFVVLATRS